MIIFLMIIFFLKNCAYRLINLFDSKKGNILQTYIKKEKIKHTIKFKKHTIKCSNTQTGSTIKTKGYGLV
jgi:hypothetical protein